MSDQPAVQGKAILPRDVQAIVERQPETKPALFQIIRSQSEMPVLRLRVGYDALYGTVAELAMRVAASVTAVLDVPCDVELVPDAELLTLGPPQIIPRVVTR